MLGWGSHSKGWVAEQRALGLTLSLQLIISDLDHFVPVACNKINLILNLEYGMVMFCELLENNVLLYRSCIPFVTQAFLKFLNHV